VKPAALGLSLLLAAGTLHAENEQRLVAAMKTRDLGTVRELVAEGVGVNELDRESASPLHWAAHWNNLEAVKLLLGAGANPNLANRFGVTPMHEAATLGNAAIMTALLEAGGDPNAAFGEGETVLMTAARAGDAGSVRALLAHGGDPNAAEGWHGQTALMWAAIENHADVVQLLLDAGAEVDRASTKHDWVEISYSQGNVPKTRDLGGLTALQFAARSGSSDAVEVLLAAGADPAKVEPMYELTSLELAIVNGHYALAKRLIERGVSVDDGSLYLLLDTRNLGFYAQRPNPPEKDGGVTSLDMLALLLEHGAKPDLPYTKGIPERTVAGQIEVPAGATPLDRAAAALDYAAIDVLLTHGASPNVATDDGTTPLMQLTGYSRNRGGAPVTNAPERLAAIRALLMAGADVDAVQEETGNTALHFAAMRGVSEIVELLEAFGASEERKNEAGKTPSDLLARSAAQKN